MSDLRQRFGRLVASHRKRKRLTQEALATAASLSPEMIGRIEAGQTGARFPTIERIAAALDVDPAELFSPDIPKGAGQRPALTNMTARLSGFNDRDLAWIDQLLDAALRSRS